MRTKNTLVALFALITTGASASNQPLEIDFDRGVETWRVVLDGVMGGRSSGRILEGDPGVLVFNGKLSMENNGGFSQARTNIDEGSLTNQKGLEVRFLGDGRTYQFDIRVSNVRLMAGGFQTTFDTKEGQWQTVRLPFDDFRLYTFGRKVPNPPALDPAKIESLGITLADKIPGAFRIEIDSIRSYQSDSSLETASTSGMDNSLGAVANAAGLNTLIKLVSLSEIKLPHAEKVTIFAPSDAAFTKLPEETLEYLASPDGRSTLQSILSYHIVSGETRSNELLNKRSLLTLNGQDLDIQLDGGLSISGAGVKIVDVPFDGGIVHVVDSVLIPESKSILELAAQTNELSTLVAAVTAAGIGDQLGSENGPWTVFAPINSAFASLPDGILEELLESKNRARLIDLLGLHVIPGRISSNELLTNQRARSYFGNKIDFSIENGQLTVQGARIISSDIQASNGVVHLIDRVITPTVSATPEQATLLISPRNQEAVRLYELAVRRGVTLFNDGQREACAFVYEIAIESMIALGSDSLDSRGVERLVMGLAEAESESDWAERAWIYRRALDGAYDRFRSQDR